jgi:hypothetical protein
MTVLLLFLAAIAVTAYFHWWIWTLALGVAVVLGLCCVFSHEEPRRDRDGDR